MSNLDRITDLICTYPGGPFALEEKFKMAIRTVAIEADDKIEELEKEIVELRAAGGINLLENLAKKFNKEEK